MDSLRDALAQKKFQEPPEIHIIKDFVQEHFRARAQVTVQPAQIVIQVKSGALAGALRMRLSELRELCQTEKKLVIRIGG